MHLGCGCGFLASELGSRGSRPVEEEGVPGQQGRFGNMSNTRIVRDHEVVDDHRLQGSGCEDEEKGGRGTLEEDDVV